MRKARVSKPQTVICVWKVAVLLTAKHDIVAGQVQVCNTSLVMKISQSLHSKLPNVNLRMLYSITIAGKSPNYLRR